jgi:hypothetical protein
MYIALIILLALCPQLASAGSWEDRRSKLDQVAIYDKYRIFYSLSGKDALPRDRRGDYDKNGIPDFIESVGVRLTDADKLFRGEVGLIPPLKSKRYIGKAHYIDVNILDFSNNKKGPKNGVAYDGTPKFNRSRSGQLSLNVLVIDLSGSVRLNTNSVEHELFHLYQNGYTFFKNRWYTEGTARWAELIMLGRIGNGASLPDSESTRERLFNKTYAANSFWNELIRKIDSGTQGKHFIKALLEELDYSDDIATRKRGLDYSYWKESEQRSTDNNIYIWKATLKAIQRTGKTSDPEINKLYKI